MAFLSIRTRWILGTLLAFVTLTWLLYPSRPVEGPDLLQTNSPYRACRDYEPFHNVAVIGAGSAGASAAYYLKMFKNPCQRLNITVYERNPYVGGRSTTVNVYDDPAQPVELGASIFVKVNQNLVNAVEAFGLPIRNMQATSKYERPEVLGVWDGEEFVFTQSDNTNKYWNIAKLLWKYGYSPIRTQNLMKKTVGSFLKMYQPPYFPFNSISETASDLDLLSAIAVTGQEFLEANSISEHFAHDIIQASTRVNYAQNLNQIHGLETMVCMAIEGAMSIKGGNWQIFDGMIKSSGANLLLNTSVTSISKNLTSNTYAIQSSTHSAPGNHSTNDDNESTYNTIILASPLQFSNISFHPPLPDPPPSIPYVSLHVTLFTSPYSLSPTFFNLPPSSSAEGIPTTILTSTSPKNKTIPFFSISTLRTVTPPIRVAGGDEGDDMLCGTRENEFLYKIFSPEPMNTSFIHSLLDNPHEYPRWQGEEAVTWQYHRRWDSYPYLPPRGAFADLRLDRGEEEAGGKVSAGGLWYTSGIEQFISTMETSSLMGSNIARLVLDAWEMEEVEREWEWWVSGVGSPS